MRLQSFFCDAASEDDHGRLHIHGIYDELAAPGFPARQDRLLLCARLVWDDDENGRQDFGIDLVDPDGLAVFTVSGHTLVTPRPAGHAPPRTHLILPLERVVFPEPGCYVARFDCGGRRVDGAALFVQRSIGEEDA